MRRVFAAVALLLAGPLVTPADTLQAAYDAADSGNGYHKYVVLQTGVTYTGGLWLGGTYNHITAEFEEGSRDVRIVGNGAIIDLGGQEICFAYCNNRFDIADCIILNGNVRFRGHDGGAGVFVPEGSVRYITFYGPEDFGVRMTGCGDEIVIERNLVVNTVDTGSDFHFFTGLPSDWLPTGPSFCFSIQQIQHNLYENWSYHSDPDANDDALRHFMLVCDYG